MAASSRELSELLPLADFQSIVECPVCREIPSPPIFQCISGHNICQSCKPNLQSCAVCKDRWSDGSRNYAVEQIIGASKYSCPNKSNGCKVEETGDSLDAHIGKCPHSLGPIMECPLKDMNQCTESSLTIGKMKEHFQDVHGYMILPPPREILRDLRSRQYRLCESLRDADLRQTIWLFGYIIEHDGHHFLAPVYFYRESICWGIFYIGPEEDAKLYRAKITLQPEMDPEAQWSVRVQSLREFGQLREASDMYRPSCHLRDFAHLATEDNGSYRFVTKYKISNDK